RHGTGHLRGAEGPEPGDADLLRGHGARSARERPASRLPAAPRLAHGLPAGAPRPRRAGRRVRVGRVVLRLQAAPQARRSPSPAPHGRGPPQALALGQLDFARSTQRSPRRFAAQLGAALGALWPWPGSYSSAAPMRGSARATPGSPGPRSPISGGPPGPATLWTSWTPAAASSAVVSTIPGRLSAAVSLLARTRPSTPGSFSAGLRLPGSIAGRPA